MGFVTSSVGDAWDTEGWLLQIPMTNSPNPNQIPNPNDQIPNKTRSGSMTAVFHWALEPGHWGLIGIWDLGIWSLRRAVTDEFATAVLNGMQMPNDPPGVGVDDIFRDVGAVIAHPLKVLGDHDVG
jgi:hypothetical protein